MTAYGVHDLLERRPATTGWPRINSSSISLWFPALTTVLAIFCGIALRILAFGVDRSLWIDEAMLSLNIVERTPAQLFEPLGSFGVMESQMASSPNPTRRFTGWKTSWMAATRSNESSNVSTDF